LSFTKN